MIVRILLLFIALFTFGAQAQAIKESYAFAVLGEPRYAFNFNHFDYVNPAAPKGGQITLSALGTFDNFNRYALRGNPGARTEQLYDTLFTTSDDEPGSYYPLIAERARYADDYSWVEVAINPRARFHDGSPITARDVEFTFQKFMTEGVPQFRLVYKGTTVKAIAPLTVRIELAKPGKEDMLSLLSRILLPYMPISEENPCLGWRGIRITLDQPEIFLIQVRAMLRANAATGNLNILLPMVTSLDEVDEARRLIERAGREVEEMIGYEIPKPRIGIMLEVPSMVFMLPHLAKRVDFISVGTNDLTQYILAVDRNNTRVANIYDSLHPAMLRALAMIAREAEIHGIDLRLCGEMAGDPMCVAILIGLGYRHLSMNGRSVARVKYLLRRIDFAEAENLAQRSLEAQLATEVRHQVAAFMERRGMGGLIRGGL